MRALFRLRFRYNIVSPLIEQLHVTIALNRSVGNILSNCSFDWFPVDTIEVLCMIDVLQLCNRNMDL